MFFGFIILELNLICFIILSSLFFGFNKVNFPVVIKYVSEFINNTTLGLELLNSFVIRDTG